MFRVNSIINESSIWFSKIRDDVIKDPLSSIRGVAISLIGLLGPPDILSVKHNDFPFKLKCNITSVANYQTQLIKLNLSKKLFKILWDDPIASREASFSLRMICGTVNIFGLDCNPYISNFNIFQLNT